MDEMLELNFNLRTVQRLGYSIGVIFTVEICKGEPKNLHTQIDTHVRTQTYMLYVEVILVYVFFSPIETGSFLSIILRGQCLTCKAQCRHHLGRFILISLSLLCG